MEKLAPTEYPVIEAIARRWSPFAFEPRRVEDEKLRSLFEAARWAASSYNEQPWAFIVGDKVHDPQTFAALLACLVPGNQVWAKDVPVLAVSLAKRHFEKSGAENPVARHDTGAALANLIIQAVTLGLQVHPMGGFDGQKVRETFRVPETYEPVAAFAIGYAGEASLLEDEKLRERHNAPRSRKPQGDFVYGGTWGEAAPFVAHRNDGTKERL